MKHPKKPDPASQARPVVELRPEEIAAAQRRAFPGPKKATAPLRVAMEGAAFAAVMEHARESLSAEVCGVLVGNICQDDAGIFTHVTHAVRGQGAAEGSTHVTFTQATWNSIHEIMDKEHTTRSIVGWYHTHPGFGVEFSDMDIFIQRNFFNGPAQVALVTDPKTDAVALAMNAGEGIHYLDRFWLDGKDYPASTPEPPPGSVADSPANQATAPQMRVLEERISQLTQAVDDMRSWLHWLLLACGAMVCIGITVFISTIIREQFRARITPPESIAHVPVPVKIGDKNVLLGVAVTQWQIPAELNALMLDLAREDAAAKKQAAEDTATETEVKPQADPKASPPASPPSSPPASNPSAPTQEAPPPPAPARP